MCNEWKHKKVHYPCSHYQKLYRNLYHVHLQYRDLMDTWQKILCEGRHYETWCWDTCANSNMVLCSLTSRVGTFCSSGNNNCSWSRPLQPWIWCNEILPLSCKEQLLFCLLCPLIDKNVVSTPSYCPFLTSHNQCYLLLYWSSCALIRRFCTIYLPSTIYLPFMYWVFVLNQLGFIYACQGVNTVSAFTIFKFKI